EQAPLDEAAPEPGRVERPGLVLEDRDRPLDAAPERGLDADVDDVDAGAHDRALLDVPQVAKLPHLAQVVVATRQVEQQLANGQEPEAAARTLQEVRGTEAGPRELGVEQLDGIGRRSGLRDRRLRT